MEGVNQDQMDNNWGCNLVNIPGCGAKTFNEFDRHVRSDVRDFKLFGLEASGTASNETAIEEATNYDFTKCMFAMGSYAGGSGKLLTMSTSTYSDEPKKGLSIPMKPEISSEQARVQTVAFPYWVECSKFSDKERKDIEAKCLLALHKRILIRWMAGDPYRAIFLELMLCGNGGELSTDFLEKLGFLAKKYRIKIIVDEVMTGGRVGPKMAMTSQTPISFRNQVEYITMGKVFNCGVVLKKIPNRPNVNEERRGNSTHLEAGEACMKWSEIQDRLERDFHQSRRNQVLSAFKLRDNEESWGKGCLIFTSKSRTWVSKGLKLRLLPMLESRKLRKGTTKDSPWNRSSLCNTLISSINEWLQHMDKCNMAEWPFTTAIVECVLNPCTTEITPEKMESMLGVTKADEMAELERAKIRRNILCRNGRCDKRAKTFFRDAIGTATENCPDIIKRVRVGKRRKLIYKINREALVYVNNANS
jgi:hypothetical protein